MEHAGTTTIELKDLMDYAGISIDDGDDHLGEMGLSIGQSLLPQWSEEASPSSTCTEGRFSVDRTPGENLADAFFDAGFTALSDALTISGLHDELPGLAEDGGVTVFAPTNEAFAALSESARTDKRIVRNLLLGHICREASSRADLKHRRCATALSGQLHKVHSPADGDDVHVGTGQLGRSDIKIAGAIVHEVESCLLVLSFLEKPRAEQVWKKALLPPPRLSALGGPRLSAVGGVATSGADLEVHGCLLHVVSDRLVPDGLKKNTAPLRPASAEQEVAFSHLTVIEKPANMTRRKGEDRPAEGANHFRLIFSIWSRSMLAYVGWQHMDGHLIVRNSFHMLSNLEKEHRRRLDKNARGRSRKEDSLTTAPSDDELMAPWSPSASSAMPSAASSRVPSRVPSPPPTVGPWPTSTLSAAATSSSPASITGSDGTTATWSLDELGSLWDEGEAASAADARGAVAIPAHWPALSKLGNLPALCSASTPPQGSDAQPLGCDVAKPGTLSFSKRRKRPPPPVEHEDAGKDDDVTPLTPEVHHSPEVLKGVIASLERVQSAIVQMAAVSPAADLPDGSLTAMDDQALSLADYADQLQQVLGASVRRDDGSPVSAKRAYGGSAHADSSKRSRLSPIRMKEWGSSDDTAPAASLPMPDQSPVVHAPARQGDCDPPPLQLTDSTLIQLDSLLEVSEDERGPSSLMEAACMLP